MVKVAFPSNFSEARWVAMKAQGKAQSSMGYRAEIDGLRAVAIVPVILCHAGVPLFEGGFLGVDIFFIIIGYLITGLIISDLQRGAFTVTGFYERRIRRIIPALYTVLLSCMIWMATLSRPDDLEALGKGVLAVALFLSNIYFYRESGYFGSATEIKPLIHTWSLGVEEQFYVLFPLVMTLFWFLGVSRIGLMLLLALAAAISLGLAEWGWRYHPEAAFFLVPTRAWELLIGAMIAVMPRPEIVNRTPAALRSVRSLASVLVVVASFVTFDEATPHPSLITLAPVLVH